MREMLNKDYLSYLYPVVYQTENEITDIDSLGVGCVVRNKNGKRKREVIECLEGSFIITDHSGTKLATSEVTHDEIKNCYVQVRFMDLTNTSNTLPIEVLKGRIIVSKEDRFETLSKVTYLKHKETDDIVRFEGRTVKATYFEEGKRQYRFNNEAYIKTIKSNHFDEVETMESIYENYLVLEPTFLNKGELEAKILGINKTSLDLINSLSTRITDVIDKLKVVAEPYTKVADMNFPNLDKADEVFQESEFVYSILMEDLKSELSVLDSYIKNTFALEMWECVKNKIEEE